MKALENAKVGDKLIVEGRNSKSMESVLKITPAGNIKTKQGIYEPSGRLRGSSIWQSAYAYVATKEDIEGFMGELKKKRVAVWLKDVKWSKYDLFTLEKVSDMLRNANPEA